MNLIPIPAHPDRSDTLFQNPDCQQTLDSYADQYSVTGFNLPWIGYFVVQDDVVMGCCGFTGQPVDGRVEIAYVTFAPYEKQGVASFACQALLDIVHETDPSLLVTTRPAPSLN